MTPEEFQYQQSFDNRAEQDFDLLVLIIGMLALSTGVPLLVMIGMGVMLGWHWRSAPSSR